MRRYGKQKEVKVMKRLIISAMTILLFCANFANAQLLKSYGVKLAYTSTSQTFDYTTLPLGRWTGMKTSAKGGFSVAAFAEWLNIPLLSVVSQIEYTQRGARMVYPVPGGWWLTDGRMDYISIPVLAKVTAPLGAINPYVLTGPRADFLVGYQYVEIYPNNSIYSNFKKATLGGSAGVGVQTSSILPVTLSAELRYNFDFLNSYNGGYLKVYNNAFDVWIGVSLQTAAAANTL
jgi:hypothetical protein